MWLMEESGLCPALTGRQGGISLWVEGPSFVREDCMLPKRDQRHRKQRRLFI